jgi:hypothetical protein
MSRIMNPRRGSQPSLPEYAARSSDAATVRPSGDIQRRAPEAEDFFPSRGDLALSSASNPERVRKITPKISQKLQSPAN